MSSTHATRAVLWEADVTHLKQTAMELLETNNRYASMFEVRFFRSQDVFAPPSSRRVFGHSLVGTPAAKLGLGQSQCKAPDHSVGVTTNFLVSALLPIDGATLCFYN